MPLSPAGCAAYACMPAKWSPTAAVHATTSAGTAAMRKRAPHAGRRHAECLFRALPSRTTEMMPQCPSSAPPQRTRRHRGLLIGPEPVGVGHLGRHYGRGAVFPHLTTQSDATLTRIARTVGDPARADRDEPACSHRLDRGAMNLPEPPQAVPAGWIRARRRSSDHSSPTWRSSSASEPELSTTIVAMARRSSRLA